MATKDKNQQDRDRSQSSNRANPGDQSIRSGNMENQGTSQKTSGKNPEEQDRNSRSGSKSGPGSINR